MYPHTRLYLFGLASLLITGVAARGPPPYTLPGVAFDLTANYGTAAIYFKNGSSLNVAQIEGTPAYKTFMRRGADEIHPVTGQRGTYYWLRDMVCSALQPLSLKFCARDPDLTSVQSLLRNLQYSVISHLGAEFCYVAVTIPDRTWQYQIRVIEQGILSIGLRQTHQILGAPRLALVTHLTDEYLYFDEARAILSVDYSASGLNMVLFAEAIGLSDVLRTSYHPHLGADHRTEDGHLEAIREAILEITKAPIGKDYNWVPLTDDIRLVSLHGDAVQDENFRDTVGGVVGFDVIDQAFDSNPVFAAAAGMARASFEEMDTWSFDFQPTWGCWWRSQIHGMAKEEL